MSKDKYIDDELLANARKPEGKLGSKIIDWMNKNHEAYFFNVKTYINKSKDSFTNEDANWICVIAKK